jgi:hypothetical protein
MLNPFGSSPVLAMWQGFVENPNPNPPAVATLVARTAYASVLTRTSVGVFLLQLSTGADDATTLVAVQLLNQTPMNAVFLSSIIYNPSGIDAAPYNEQVQLTFTDLGNEPADPTGFFNIIVSDVNDGIDEFPGNP